MSELFLNVVGMSVSAGVIVLAVLLLRLPLKKAPKWITVLLWSIAAFRLVCPVTVESAVGLIPSFAGTLQVGDALDAGIISNAGDISDDGNSGIDNGVNNESASFKASIIRICSFSGGIGINIDINSSNLRLSTVVTDLTSSLRIYGSKALIA